MRFGLHVGCTFSKISILSVTFSYKNRFNYLWFFLNVRNRVVRVSTIQKNQTIFDWFFSLSIFWLYVTLFCIFRRSVFCFVSLFQNTWVVCYMLALFICETYFYRENNCMNHRYRTAVAIYNQIKKKKNPFCSKKIYIETVNGKISGV